LQSPAETVSRWQLRGYGKRSSEALNLQRPLASGALRIAARGSKTDEPQLRAALPIAQLL
jgi:hypothetical protein